MTDTDQLTPEEAARRRDEVVKRMLATPPQPKAPKPRKANPKAYLPPQILDAPGLSLPATRLLHAGHR